MLINRCKVLAVLAAGFLLPALSFADSYQVYVGYADTLRTSGFFPNPFAGAPGVVYSGQDPSVGFLDSGAVRIDNTGTTSITLSNLKVILDLSTGPVSFSPWSSVTIAPGQKAIFAQTFQYNFDSSDYGFLSGTGVDATHPVGGCTNLAAYSAAQQALCTSNAPVVTFMENGASVSKTDSGNILDTFGYDFINGSSDGNESINWNVIGSTATRGGNATPEPASFLLLGSGALLISLGSLRRRVAGKRK